MATLVGGKILGLALSWWDPRERKKDVGNHHTIPEPCGTVNATFSKSTDGSEGEELALLGADCVNGGGKGIVKDGLGEASVEAEYEGRGRETDAGI